LFDKNAHSCLTYPSHSKFVGKLGSSGPVLRRL